MNNYTLIQHQSAPALVTMPTGKGSKKIVRLEKGKVYGKFFNVSVGLHYPPIAFKASEDSLSGRGLISIADFNYRYSPLKINQEIPIDCTECEGTGKGEPGQYSAGYWKCKHCKDGKINHKITSITPMQANELPIEQISTEFLKPPISGDEWLLLNKLEVIDQCK